jgi:hypothetical protein
VPRLLWFWLYVGVSAGGGLELIFGALKLFAPNLPL